MEDDRHLHLDQRMGDRVDGLLAQLHVEHRAVGAFALERFERAGDVFARSDDLVTGILQRVRDVERDDIFVLYDEDLAACVAVADGIESVNR